MIAIIIGHSEKDKGAHNKNFNISEFDYNKLVAEKIAQLKKVHIIYRDDYKSLPDKVNNTDAELAISLHCNAFNSTTEGCETLHSGSKKGLELASKLHKPINDLFGNKDRGIKSRGIKDRGGWLLHKTTMPCVILEPFFIDNDMETQKALSLIDEYAKVIVNSLSDY